MLHTLKSDLLQVSIGQYSSAGRKAENQDFHGAIVPEGSMLEMKGVALAIADGISTSPVARIAAETAVKSFLTDYYCTSDAWTAKTAASRVIDATNSWLHAQSRHLSDRNLAHVATFSALVLKQSKAHIFHVGDSRISRIIGHDLEPLTNEHRRRLSSDENYLGRALGLLPSVEIDYRPLRVEVGDVFVLTTDGVHDHVGPRQIVHRIASAADLDQAAAAIVQDALEAGSEDNLTIQIVRIDRLPGEIGDLLLDDAIPLPPAPLPQAPGEFEGYRIHRQIHASSRSHIFHASEPDGGEQVVLKFPSADLRGDAGYLRRFAMEEWIARRVSSVHILKPKTTIMPRRSLYLATEYVEGETLSQWMRDRDRVDVRSMRDIVSQIAAGLQALHRKEILHQDLRPDNIMISREGTVKIIDYGSAQVAGVAEAEPWRDTNDILGTFQYTAPEYFLGESGTEASDIFSLGVIAYQLLTGCLPYGAEVARTHKRSQQAKLRFISLRSLRPEVPVWLEGAIRKTVHPEPARRYQAVSEFLHDLSHPNPDFLLQRPVPLAERNPVLFWQLLSLALALLVLSLLWQLR
jgi:serine/threonine protein phosphatase PrpC